MFGLANPTKFMRFSGILLPYLIITTLGLFGWGLYMVFTAPEDYLQGPLSRILYVHAPSAYLAQAAYVFMALANFTGYIWRHPLADMAAKNAAPIGATFALLTIITGMLWGKPAWGTWWVWDARLTSVFILFIMYLGYIAIWQVIEDQVKAARVATIVAAVGLINIPIIKFSVEWWNTLHQPASLTTSGSAIHPSMLTALLIMFAAFTFLFTSLLFISIRTEINRRRARAMEMRILQQNIAQTNLSTRAAINNQEPD
ncbi:MAG: heme ABC transporter permease [Rhizobiales bacterium]|nr:heme ABC transporter permease [Hyphomicrobiales bacterium]NRB14589.1 heme ABC transporter permease [Hyphomicrobiales bacterium]